MCAIKRERKRERERGREREREREREGRGEQYLKLDKDRYSQIANTRKVVGPQWPNFDPCFTL